MGSAVPGKPRAEVSVTSSVVVIKKISFTMPFLQPVSKVKN